MQKELTEGRLLDAKGNLAEAGFGYRLVRDYRRKDIKAGKLRIKEWDYYYIGNPLFGLALTIDDNSYMSMASVTFFDFAEKKDYTKSPITFFSLGRVGLPSSSSGGTTKIKGRGYSLSFYNDGDTRHLVGHMDNLTKGKSLSFDLVLAETNRRCRSPFLACSKVERSSAPLPCSPMLTIQSKHLASLFAAFVLALSTAQAATLDQASSLLDAAI